MGQVETKDVEPEEDFGETTVVGEFTDNVGDVSVEINVEELLHDLEVDGILTEGECKEAARRRFEEVMEKKRAARELEDFDDYDV
jgi:hypothetical protein